MNKEKQAFKTSINAYDIDKNSTVEMYNNTLTNNLSKINYKKHIEHATPDEISREIGINLNKTEVIFKGDTANYNTETVKLLDLIYQNYTSGKYLDGDITTLYIDDYLELKGLKPTKKNRYRYKKNIWEHLEVLANIKVKHEGEYYEKNNKGKNEKKTISLKNLNILSYELVNSKSVRIALDPLFLKYYRGSALLRLPKQVYRIDSRYYPYTYHISRYIFEQKRIKKVEDKLILKIKSVYENAPIRSYEDIKEHKLSYITNVRLPLERDLDKLEDDNIIEWRYCYSGGSTTEDITNYLDNLSFEQWQEETIEITFLKDNYDYGEFNKNKSKK